MRSACGEDFAAMPRRFVDLLGDDVAGACATGVTVRAGRLTILGAALCIVSGLESPPFLNQFALDAVFDVARKDDVVAT